jgi:hypothetical protein
MLGSGQTKKCEKSEQRIQEHAHFFAIKETGLTVNSVYCRDALQQLLKNV